MTAAVIAKPADRAVVTTVVGNPPVATVRHRSALDDGPTSRPTTLVTSRDEAKQIAANVTGIFSVLADWSRAELSGTANDNDNAEGTNSASDGGRYDR